MLTSMAASLKRLDTPRQPYLHANKDKIMLANEEESINALKSAPTSAEYPVVHSKAIVPLFYLAYPQHQYD